MSVWFGEQVIAKLRGRGVVVSDQWTDWRRNGNGQTSDYQGAIMHHTATDYGDAFPALVHGRPDLAGPLCNSAGCADGSITIVAAHPANHAGAAGGSWARPFPDTQNFNRMVWGHEIVYPGNSPMTGAQWRSMVILGQVICEILGKGPEWIRGHYETSVTGKWDPGYAPGKWIDMNEVRRQIGGAPVGGADLDGNQHEALMTIRHQLTGSTQAGKFPGFPSFLNEDVSMTPLDFGRNIDARLFHMRERQKQHREAIASLAKAVAQAHDVDSDAIVAMIQEEITTRIERAVKTNVRRADEGA
jgi:hypothetical protein